MIHKSKEYIVDTLLYYTRDVNSTLVAALSTISSQKANGMKAIKKDCHQLLDYLVTHPNAVLGYLASDMIRVVLSDASYLSKAKARRRSGGHFYLTNKDDEEFKNGSVITLPSIIKNSIAPASEAEITAMFYNKR